MSPGPLRVLIADDHPLFRAGMRALLETVPDLEVVGVASSGDEALVLAQQGQPDVVLMDLQMPGLGGIEATRRIVDACPTTAVLVVTMFEHDYSVFTAMRAGARGYVLKDADEEEVLRAIRAFPELSQRERQVLELIAQGTGNAAIAERLCLSPKTVRNHISNIFSKLQVADRAEAIVRAREAGLG